MRCKHCKIKVVRGSKAGSVGENFPNDWIHYEPGWAKDAPSNKYHWCCKVTGIAILEDDAERGKSIVKEHAPFRVEECYTVFGSKLSASSWEVIKDFGTAKDAETFVANRKKFASWDGWEFTIKFKRTVYTDI
jgi:hypothetical protein